MKSVIVSIPGTKNCMLNRKRLKHKKIANDRQTLEQLLEQLLKYTSQTQFNILFKAINLLIIYSKPRYTNLAETEPNSNWY